MNRLLLLIFSILSCSAIAWADNIQFTASAPRVVETGEQFQVTYTITAEPSGFKPPEFKGLNLLGGPSQSSSTSVQIINGKMSQNSSYNYTYYFSANTPGTFTFEPAKATVDGKSYLSNSITIQVAGSSQNTNNQTNNATSQGSAAGSQTAVAEANNEDIFVRVIVDKTNLYQGEHVVATIKLFSKLNISAIEKVDYPSFTGFFRQDIETQPLRQLEREVVNGQVYHTGVLQRMVLFPQKSGDIVIDQLTLQTVVQIAVKGRARSIFDDFWGPQVQEVRKKIISKPVKINVRALPANAPDSYHGAVGNFTFKAALDKNKVKTNDAINLKISIAGNGNLKVIEPLDIKFPSDFETYDPKISVNAPATAAGVSGNKTFEYLMIPRHSGNFTIPAIEFTYFDSQSKTYKTLSSGELTIEVEKGANDATSTVVSGVSKEDVKFLGKDIQFIKTKTGKFNNRGEYFFGSMKFWLSYIIAALVFMMIIILWRKRIRENANIVAVRNKKANKVAHKKLKDAHLYMKENKKEEFYEYILKALWGYMSDKLSIPVSELSRDKVLEETAKRNIDNDSIQRFLSILDTCEFARYAPAEGTAQMDAVYKDAIDVISHIEQKMR